MSECGMRTECLPERQPMLASCIFIRALPLPFLASMSIENGGLKLKLSALEGGTFWTPRITRKAYRFPAQFRRGRDASDPKRTRQEEALLPCGVEGLEPWRKVWDYAKVRVAWLMAWSGWLRSGPRWSLNPPFHSHGTAARPLYTSRYLSTRLFNYVQIIRAVQTTEEFQRTDMGKYSLDPRELKDSQ